MRADGWLWGGLLAVMLAGCHAEKAADFQSLFNGTDLSGWEVKCKSADTDRSFWSVDDGTILADSMGATGHDYVWLCTTREYADFVLTLKFQAYRDSPGNSGVQIRSRYDDQAGWLDGPQVDINPPGPWRTGMIWDETRGNARWLYPDIPAGQWVEPSMAVAGHTFFYHDDDDGWNDLTIVANGTQLRAELNGLEVMRYDGDGVLNDATHRQRQVGEAGAIALQIHKGDQLRIRFKEIAIRDLTGQSGR